MGEVKIRQHWDVYDPLDRIPKDEWQNIVLKKAHHVREIIHTRLDDALEILNDLELHEAWVAAAMQKDFFLRTTCGVPPEDLPKLRQGYAIMRGLGHLNPTPAQAMAVVEPLARHGEKRGWSAAKIERLHALRSEGYKLAEIAEQLGVSVPTVTRQLRRLKQGMIIIDRDSTFDDHGRGIEYLAARIKRDRPDIAQRIAEFPNIHAAAKAAGIVRVKSPLAKLLTIWGKTSAEERTTFLETIGLLENTGHHHSG